MNLAQYAADTGIKPFEFRKLLKEQHGLDLDHETVRRWLNGTLQPAPKRMSVIEAATGGRVTRYHQRPDIYGKPPKAIARKRRAA